jgi:serine/threonine protein kinase/CRP-like cAMP-binding protein
VGVTKDAKQHASHDAKQSGGQSDLFGRYQLLEPIAVGGMAELFLAQSASLGGVNRTCVIKRILPQYSRDLTFVSMFIDEARITIGLEHANIVKLYDFGQVDGTYFMAMEYVDGTDLSALMRAHLLIGRPLPPALAAFVARDILRGLAHAHALKDHTGRPLGIVHRDVSPQNVLLSTNGDVKITDFGIAAARHKLTLTSPGTVLGKAAYMSPEQATGKPVDFRTDIWAVGVILHEMLSGERLFADDSPLQTVQRVAHDAIEPPSSKARGVPPALDWIVMRALDRSVKARYPSAGAMADEISAFLAAELIEGHSFGPADLSRYLADLEWADDTAQMRPSHRMGRGSQDSTGPQLPQLIADRELERLVGQLKKQPDVWALVAIGDRYVKLAHNAAAVSAYRTAAAVFAHRGLLVQALCAYDPAKAFLTPPEVHADLLAIGDLSAGSYAELKELVASFDRFGFFQLLQDADPDGFGAGAPALPFPVPQTPLFGSLGPTELAKIGARVSVRRTRPGEILIREGEEGDAVFAVGRGRLVVYCLPGHIDDLAQGMMGGDFVDPTKVEEARERRQASFVDVDRVYLAGLADGDFFGEFSFLTEKPRSATVECITEGLLLEIRREAVRDLLDADASFAEPLLQFYKERVVELMMAKSSVFSLLEPHERRALLRDSTVREVVDSEVIVEEGTTSDSFYFIKRGEVEVFRNDDSGIPIFINKLSQGQFFGEIAALKKGPRRFSVRSMGDGELFVMPRASLVDILNRQPKLRDLFDATIAARTAEAQDRVREHQRVFFGT